MNARLYFFQVSPLVILLIRKALSQAKLQDLSKVSSEELTLEFKEGIQNLKRRVLSKIACKHTNQNVSLNGPSFSSLVRFLVSSANENQVPELPSLFDSWVSKLSGNPTIQNYLYMKASAHADSLTAFKQQTNLLLQAIPPSEEEIKKNISLIQNECFSYYKELLFQLENLYKPGLPSLKVYFPM